MNLFSLIKPLAKITAAFVLVANSAFAAGGGDSYIKDFDFSFEGPLGSYDQNQLQRGL